MKQLSISSEQLRSEEGTKENVRPHYTPFQLSLRHHLGINSEQVRSEEEEQENVRRQDARYVPFCDQNGIIWIFRCPNSTGVPISLCDHLGIEGTNSNTAFGINSE